MKTLLLVLLCLLSIALNTYTLLEVTDKTNTEIDMKTLGIWFSISFIALVSCICLLNHLVKKDIEKYTGGQYSE